LPIHGHADEINKVAKYKCGRFIIYPVKRKSIERRTAIMSKLFLTAIEHIVDEDGWIMTRFYVRKESGQEFDIFVEGKHDLGKPIKFCD